MMEILPLLLFTTCSGAAAGAYVMRLLGDHHSENRNLGGEKLWLFPLVCIILLAVGLLGTLAHLGQPLRFINGLSNPASMISQESYWAIAFGILMVIELIISKTKNISPVVLHWAGALAATGLMVVMSLAYYHCTFLPAWSSAITIPLFIVGNLVMGAGLCILFSKNTEASRLFHLANTVLSMGWVVVILSYVIYLSGLGFGVALPIIGAVVGPAGSAAVSILAHGDKLTLSRAAIIVFVLNITGVLLVRVAFFAAGVL